MRINRIRIPSVRRLATEITVRRQRTPPGDLGVYLCLEVVVGKEPRWGVHLATDPADFDQLTASFKVTDVLFRGQTSQQAARSLLNKTWDFIVSRLSEVHYGKAQS